MSKLFKNQRALKKTINITIQEVENRLWRVEITEMEPPNQFLGDNKKQVLALAKAEVLKRLVDSLENFEIDFNKINFKIDNKSLKNNFFSLRETLSTIWKAVVEWSREQPHFEYFLQTIITSLITWQVIALLFLAGAIIFLVKSLINDDQVFATIFTASIAFIGVILTIIVNNWATIYKSQIERQTDAINTMKNYYELTIKILKNPGFYSLEEIINFIDDFDNKVEIYSSPNIVHQWKRIKEKIPLVQANASNTDSKDYHDFKNFIGAIRKEIGYSSTPGVRSHIHKELRRRYQNRESENS